MDSGTRSCSTGGEGEYENLMIRTASKEKMHPRNRFRGAYDFGKLVATSPPLARFVRPNPFGDLSIDFADDGAVRALNRALLAEAYSVTGWDLPPRYLCPPIPGRSDYIHHLADLIADGGEVPRGPAVSVLDIGTGASLVYPLIGASEYGWRFVGSDIDPVALSWAAGLITAQPALRDLIEIRAQPDRTSCFKGVIRPGEFFTATLCNPPFHASAEQARAGNERKRRNLGGLKRDGAMRNFGGQPGELWCPGGELGFALRLIEQSVAVKDRCRWFTILVSKSAHLPRLREALVAANAGDIRTIEMGQGQKLSRVLAWTFRASAKPGR